MALLQDEDPASDSELEEEEEEVLEDKPARKRAKTSSSGECYFLL